MAEPTEVQTVPGAVRLLALNALLAVTGPFNAMKLVLYKTPVTPGPATAFADLTLADFTGYAAVAGQVFSAAYYDVDFTALSLGEDALFLCSGSAISNTIYGYALLDTAGAVLLAIFPFDQPVAVNMAGEAVTVVPFLRYSGN